MKVRTYGWTEVILEVYYYKGWLEWWCRVGHGQIYDISDYTNNVHLSRCSRCRTGDEIESILMAVSHYVYDFESDTWISGTRRFDFNYIMERRSRTS